MVLWYFRPRRRQLAGDVATMLAYLALGIPPAGHVRRLDTQTITVTGGSFSSPYYTFDGGAPPTPPAATSRRATTPARS